MTHVGTREPGGAANSASDDDGVRQGEGPAWAAAGRAL